MNPNSKRAFRYARKSFLTSVFLIQITFSAFCQFNYGLRAGTQMVSLGGAPKVPSYHLGLFGSYHFTDRISLNVDALYSDKGYQSDYYSHDRYHMVYLS